MNLMKFDPPHPRREILQYTKCQRYGHSERFCHLSLRWVNCVVLCDRITSSPFINPNHYSISTCILQYIVYSISKGKIPTKPTVFYSPGHLQQSKQKICSNFSKWWKVSWDNARLPYSRFKNKQVTVCWKLALWNANGLDQHRHEVET